MEIIQATVAQGSLTLTTKHQKIASVAPFPSTRYTMTQNTTFAELSHWHYPRLVGRNHLGARVLSQLQLGRQKTKPWHCWKLWQSPPRQIHRPPIPKQRMSAAQVKMSPQLIGVEKVNAA